MSGSRRRCRRWSLRAVLTATEAAPLRAHSRLGLAAAFRPIDGCSSLWRSNRQQGGCNPYQTRTEQTAPRIRQLQESGNCAHLATVRIRQHREFSQIEPRHTQSRMKDASRVRRRWEDLPDRASSTSRVPRNPTPNSPKTTQQSPAWVDVRVWEGPDGWTFIASCLAPQTLSRR